MARQIKYVEPVGYFPKEIREKVFKAQKAEKTEKKTTTKKTQK